MFFRKIKRTKEKKMAEKVEKLPENWNTLSL